MTSGMRTDRPRRSPRVSGKLVSDYLDGVLDPPLAAAVQRHLVLCPPCVEYVRQLRLTTELLGRLPEETLSERARTEILTAFRGFRRPTPALMRLHRRDHDAGHPGLGRCGPSASGTGWKTDGCEPAERGGDS